MRAWLRTLRALEDVEVETVEELRPRLAAVADEGLDKVLVLAGETHLGNMLLMQFSTRELPAHEDGDVLRVDAVRLLEGAANSTLAWVRIHEALSLVKR